MRNTLTILLSLLCLSARAATWYIQSGSTGTSGSDWYSTNALNDLPTQLVSSNTYWIGNGNGYHGRSLGGSTGYNAVTNVLVKKATITSHGTDNGWNNSYASSASFGTNMFSWWFADGCMNITNDGSYFGGFQFVVGEQTLHTAAFTIKGSASGSCPNIVILNCSIQGLGDNGLGDGQYNYPWHADSNPWGVDAASRNGFTCPGLVISNCWISGLINCFTIDRADGLVIANNELAWSEGWSGNHGNIGQIYHSDNVLFYNNFIHNFSAEGLEIVDGNSNSKYYGNVVYGGQSGGSTSRWIEDYDNSYPNYTYANNQYYNNTLCDLQLQAFYFMAGAIVTGTQITNNIFMNTTPGFSGGDYNWYSGGSNNGETHGIAGGSTVPFNRYVGSANGFTGTNIPSIWFNLTNAIPGLALSSQYNTDIAGNTRGSDGVWDVGAFEYITNAILPSVINIGSATIINLRN
jgi:hypothetical protein